MKNRVNWGNGFAIGDANSKNCPLNCLIFQTNEESFGYAETLELKVNSYAIACVRQRPGDCRKEFQINLKWSVPSIEMLSYCKTELSTRRYFK